MSVGFRLRQLDFRKKQAGNGKYRKNKNAPQAGDGDIRKLNGITGSEDCGYKGAENTDSRGTHSGADHPVPYLGATGAQCDGRTAQ